jgi:hypothetical protein
LTKGGPDDPKGLIFEAYRMDAIGKAECRSIFLDWALSLPLGHDTGPAMRRLFDLYGRSQPDHPMTQVITEGLAGMQAPRRRGGWRSRARKSN